MYPVKNIHKFLSLRKILNDYFKSVFYCYAPIDGGVGGYLRMKRYTKINAIAEAKNYPA